MAEREQRKKIDKGTIDFLKPLNIQDFVEENDPCFGKHHDLKAPECTRCGDAEVCSIISAQSANNRRELLEKTHGIKQFHDKPNYKAIRKLIRSKLKKKVSKNKIIQEVMSKWSIKEKAVEKQIKKVKTKMKK